ncbi:alkaline phosphatase family protein [Pseudoroseicyclus tamaricis]|uniref:Alkaline phosphatase family protein n=1 Tax=Pseudoroseicyclus tamaricis TaxID=2705421 RepID=A0A6B2JV98_9RHOB|nr:alkaline phosphatase family protein [Pseudoroseicyclus tamaricis]NDV02427.1 alkaline phosphatase family protein [Pseudoroseicyclus tamaricis]
MSKPKNVLWIMADQLRFDYLSCYGHPHLHTPNIDRLAARGVRFTNAYVQSPICGPSRMSSYTGRYTRSHGATWNGFPLRVGEPTLGDHLREIGVRPVIVGKTHMVADTKGMEWLGIDPGSTIGISISECGFEPYERDDGMHPYGPYDPDPAYNRALQEAGVEGDNPWEEHANSAAGDDGERLSGWLLKYANLPADVPEELSETPYMTRRAMQFMEEAGDAPWLCHLSFIKPHWPYIVPAPYHDMYGPEHILPPVRAEAEKVTDHPVFRAFIESRICRSFARDEVRERVIPAYMGLIKQIDDQMGVLLGWMEERGLFETTMIVFTSDHGDYLGDHWMGEKDLFHEPSVKVPLIVYDPRPEADDTRGTVRSELVEAIDLAPTFLSYFGGPAKPHILEGRGLEPLLHNRAKPAEWRQYAVSEYDYATRPARQAIGNAQEEARLVMLRDGRWKYVHAEGFRPMLFDLQTDPDELHDLGASRAPEHAAVRARMMVALGRWSRRHHNRITLSPEQIEAMTGKEPPGILIGFWDEAEYEAEFGKPFAERP